MFKNGAEYILKHIQFLLICIIFYWILFNNPYIYNSYIYKNNHYVFCILILCTLLFSLLKETFFRQKAYTITLLDIAFFASFIAILISRINNASGIYFNEILTNYILLCCWYVIVRVFGPNSLNKSLLLLLAGSFFIEAAILLVNLPKSSNYLFLTGSLDNSGLCAGYMMMFAPLVMYFIPSDKKYISTVFIIVCIIILFILKSRTAVFSFVPTLCIWIRSLSLYSFFTKVIWLKIKRKTLVIASSTLLLLPVVAYMISCKFDSALGRVFIWKLSVKNFTNYIMGIGYGEFPVYFQRWQIDYFQNDYKGSAYANVADLPNNVFNEPLQILIETGLIGFLAFLASIYIVIKCSTTLDNRLQLSLKISLFTTLIFSLFSYPFHSLPILLFIVLVFAILSSYSESGFSFIVRGRYMRIFIVSIMTASVISINYFAKKNEAVQNWKIAKALEKSDKYKAIEKYDIAYPFLYDNGRFLMNYGVALFNTRRFDNSIMMFKQSSKLIANIDNSLYLGKAYQALKEFDISEKYYFTAQYNLPSRLNPKYCLMKLFILEKDTINAKRIAENILETPVKVVSIEAYQIKQAAYDYLAYKKSIPINGDAF